VLVNGLWGVLSVGIFANGAYGAGWNGVVREEYVKLYGSDGVRGLLYGDFSQFIMQIIDCIVVAIFGFLMAYIWFKISDVITPLRVDRETEMEGLDGPEMGVLGYPLPGSHGPEDGGVDLERTPEHEVFRIQTERPGSQAETGPFFVRPARQIPPLS